MNNNNKIKVLWFCNTPAAGDEKIGDKSSGGWLKSLDKALQNKVSLHIAFYSKTKKDSYSVCESTYYPIFKKKKSVLHKLFNQYFFFQDNDDTDKFLSIVKKVSPDIIHIHGTEMPFITILYRTNIPIVISIQGVISVIYHKYCSGIDKKYLFRRDYSSILSALKSRGNIISYKNFILKAKTEQTYLRKAKYIIGRTDWDKRVSSVMAPDSHYFHNDEILRDSFYLNNWNNMYKKGDKLIIHTTCSDAFYKGFETICQCIAILNNNNVDIEWRVAGISKSQLINRIVKKQLKSNYPTKGLILLGNISEKELVDKLLESHLYINASHIENSPNSLCEAMILGMPCISTFVGGVGCLIADKESGILIQEGDPWAMAGSIMEMKNNPDVFVNYGIKGKIIAEKRHDKSKISDELLSIYKLLVNR